MGSPEAERQLAEQKHSMVMTVVLFIVGLSVIMSYQWWTDPPSWRPDAPFIILFGILVAAVIYILSGWAFRSRYCTACGRRIPFDSRLCPYCGRDFSK